MPDHESGDNGPNFIALRIREADGQLLTVVAALDPDHDCRFPWATWYHEQAPTGEFKKVPGGYPEMAISDAVAKTMIELIRAGRPLPPEFVAGLMIRD
jgi:hypothetical protein